jgi:hypothetical protein
MNEPVQLSAKDGLEREIFYLFISDFSEFPAKIELSSKNFVLFFACDAYQLRTETLSEWSDKLIDNGLVYLSVWGNDCERVHDIFDEALVSREEYNNGTISHIMTTWHADKSLEEALWFALNTTFPVEEYVETCKSLLIIAVKDAEWDKYLRLQLSDVNTFIEMVLQKDAANDE